MARKCRSFFRPMGNAASFCCIYRGRNWGVQRACSALWPSESEGWVAVAASRTELLLAAAKTCIFHKGDQTKHESIIPFRSRKSGSQ